jgi:hypothetical protein
MTQTIILNKRFIHFIGLLLAFLIPQQYVAQQQNREAQQLEVIRSFKNGKYGYRDKTTKELIIPCEFDRFIHRKGKSIVAIKDKKYGVIDSTRRIILPFEYTRISILTEDIVIATKERQTRLYNHNNQAISRSYDYITKQDNGFPVTRKNGKEGIIDTLGNELIPPSYDGIEYLADDLYAAEINEKYGVINLQKNWIIKPAYNWIEPVSFGKLFFVEGEFGMGIIDNTGKTIVPCIYDDLQVFTDYDIDLDNPQWILCTKDGKEGILDATGREIIPTKYHHIELIENKLFVGSQYSRWDEDLFTSNGKLLYSEFDYISPFNSYSPLSQPYFIVEKDREEGIIDSTGKEIIPIEWDEIKPFDDQSAIVINLGRWSKGCGVINMDGSFKIPLQYQDLLFLSPNRLLAKKHSKYGIIDSAEKIVVEFKFKDAILLSEEHIIFLRDSVYSLYNTTKNTFSELDYDYVSYPQETYTLVQKNKLHGLINNEGKEIIEPFIPQIGWRHLSATAKKLDRYGSYTYITHEGKKVVIQNDSALNAFYKQHLNDILEFDKGDFYKSEKRKNYCSFNVSTVHQYGGPRGTSPLTYYDALQVGANSKRGFINVHGEEIIPVKYSYLTPQYDPCGNYVVQASLNGLQGVLSTDGSVIIPCKYSYISKLSNYWMVQYGDKKKGLIDCNGKSVLPVEYDRIKKSGGKGFILEKDKKWQITNEKLEPLTEVTYDDISFSLFENNRARVKKGELYGYINRKGDLTIPIIYEEVSEFKNGLASVENNGKKGVIDTNNALLIPFIYDEIVIGYNKNNPHIKVGIKDSTIYQGRKIQATKFGLIDKLGNVVIPIEYQTIYNDYNSFEKNQIYVRKLTENDNLYGFIDKNGKEIAMWPTDEMVDLGSDYWALEEWDNKRKYDRNYKLKYGVFHATKGEVLPQVYDKIEVINKEYDLIYLAKNRRVGIYSLKKEKWLTEIIYSGFSDFHNGILRVDNRTAQGLLNRNGKWLLPVVYSYIGLPDANGLMRIEQNGLWGYATIKGDIILKPENMFVEAFKDGKARITKNKSTVYYINTKGKCIEECEVLSETK